MLRLTIIGFGNQAKSWAMNLKDSAFPIRIAIRSGSDSIAAIQALGIDYVEIGSKEFFEDQFFTLLTPDDSHADFIHQYGSQFRQQTTILYNHGFSLTQHQFQSKYPDLNHVLFAVKAIGKEIRTQYQQRGKLGAVYSLEYVNQNPLGIEAWLKSMAHSLGINMGLFKTTFQHETHADLFSEQGLLCSLIPYTASEMFNTLIAKGIEPELAYLECWHELKLIVNAMVDMGPEGFYDLISPNALIGSEKGYQKLITPDFKQKLDDLYSEIESQQFNQEIKHTNISEIRNTIRARWEQSALMKTFRQINRDET